MMDGTYKLLTWVQVVAVLLLIGIVFILGYNTGEKDGISKQPAIEWDSSVPVIKDRTPSGDYMFNVGVDGNGFLIKYNMSAIHIDELYIHQGREAVREIYEDLGFEEFIEDSNKRFVVTIFYPSEDGFQTIINNTYYAVRFDERGEVLEYSETNRIF